MAKSKTNFLTSLSQSFRVSMISAPAGFKIKSKVSLEISGSISSILRKSSNPLPSSSKPILTEPHHSSICVRLSGKRLSTCSRASSRVTIPDAASAVPRTSKLIASISPNIALPTATAASSNPTPATLASFMVWVRRSTETSVEPLWLTRIEKARETSD